MSHGKFSLKCLNNLKKKTLKGPFFYPSTCFTRSLDSHNLP